MACSRRTSNAPAWTRSRKRSRRSRTWSRARSSPSARSSRPSRPWTPAAGSQNRAVLLRFPATGIHGLRRLLERAEGEDLARLQVLVDLVGLAQHGEDLRLLGGRDQPVLGR